MTDTTTTRIEIPPRVATAAVVTDDRNRILLLRRAMDALTGAGEWGVPGGKLDPGETLEACAARELDEETGVKATTLERMQTLTEDMAWGPDLHFINLYHRVTAWEGEARIMEPTKHIGLRWVHPEEIMEAIENPQPDFTMFEPLVSFVAQGGLDELAAK